MSIEKLVRPKISVLLAAYNGMLWVNEQLESILNQEDVDVTIFVSVDLSEDETYEWFKSKEANDERIVVLPYGERFGGAARNFFRLIREVDFSKFDYVALSDQDDVWLKNKLVHSVDSIFHKNLSAFSSDVTAFWANGREVLVKKSYPQKKYDYLFEAAGPGCTYVFNAKSLMCFKVFLCSNWHEVNAVSLHDWMLYAYFRHKGMRWMIDDVPLMRYRQHNSNQVGFNSGISAYLKRVAMVGRKWYRSEVSKIFNLLFRDDKSRFNLGWRCLIVNSFHLRRRPRDAFFLFAMILFGVF